MITTFLGLGFFLFVYYCLSVYSFSCFPNRWQLLIEGLYLTTAGLIWDSIGPAGQTYFGETTQQGAPRPFSVSGG